MFPYNQIIILLGFFGYIAGRGIYYQNDEKKNQQNSQFGVSTTFATIPENDETTLVLPVSMDKLMGILTKKNSGRFERKEPQKKSSRLKRSYFPYTSEQKWPRHVSLNAWTTNEELRDAPYVFSISSYDEKITRNDPKYMYFHNVEELSSKYENDSEGPVWDMEIHYLSTPKPSRYFRTSKHSPTPSRSRENKDISIPHYIEKNFVDRNEVLKFPFLMPSSDNPSNCTLAILSCCSKYSEEVNKNCFGHLGCDLPLLADEICKPDYVQIAIKVVEGFYKSV